MKLRATVALLLLGAAACKDSTGSNGGGVTSVTISPASPTTTVGGTVQLNASAAGGTFANTDFSWQSLEPGTATVNASGLVTGAAVGNARIVASLQGKADTVTVQVSAGTGLGSMTLNMNPNGNGCTATPLIRQANIVATTAHAIFVDDVANPAGGFTVAEYQEIANLFEATVWPLVTTTFGTPADIDGNGKVIVLYSRVVNELSAPSSNEVVGGFFWSRDLFPRVATGRFGSCAASNQAEMFYMLVADPSGAINNNVRTKDYVRRSTIATLGHELQHLINSSRRMYVNNSPVIDETVWLNEGLSHVSEELLFYQATSIAPRSNLSLADFSGNATRNTAFFDYQIQNFLRYQDYLRSPNGISPYGNGDSFAIRGAGWHFLRYAADRRGGDERPLWFSLVNSTTQGLPNLSQALGGTDMMTWYRDWGVATYTDDAVAGVAAQYTHPSWNYRNMYSSATFTSGGKFALPTVSLAASNPATMALPAGSSAYVRFAVAAGQTAEIRTSTAGTTVAGACQTTLSQAVGEVFHGTPSNASVVCVQGGSTGAEYVLIPFHGSTVGSATTSISVAGTNVTAAAGPPTPSRSPVGDIFASAAPVSTGDEEFHLRLRESERELAASLLRGGARFDVAADPAPATVQLTFVRTK